MSRAVWKFPFHPAHPILIQMPKGAQVLSVQCQSDRPFLWAFVDPHAEREVRGFYAYEAGQTIESNDLGQFVGTFQMPGGHLVFHMWEASDD